MILQSYFQGCSFLHLFIAPILEPSNAEMWLRLNNDSNEVPTGLTTFIALFSLKVLLKSVAISIPTISTALLSSPCFLTNSSLAKTAAALPSDVGLKFTLFTKTVNKIRLTSWREEGTEACWQVYINVQPCDCRQSSCYKANYSQCGTPSL